VHAGCLKAAVTAPAERGQANEALIRLLANTLGVNRAQVALAAGHASRQKQFLVTGIGLREAEARLNAALAACLP
jgi:hypothetical protein